MWLTVVLVLCVAVALGLPFILHCILEMRAFTSQNEHWHTD